MHKSNTQNATGRAQGHLNLNQRIETSKNRNTFWKESIQGILYYPRRKEKAKSNRARKGTTDAGRKEEAILRRQNGKRDDAKDKGRRKETLGGCTARAEAPDTRRRTKMSSDCSPRENVEATGGRSIRASAETTGGIKSQTRSCRS